MFGQNPQYLGCQPLLSDIILFQTAKLFKFEYQTTVYSEKNIYQLTSDYNIRRKCYRCYKIHAAISKAIIS